MEQNLRKVESKIEEVELEIKAVAKKISNIEEQIEKTTDPEEKKYLRKKEEQLQKKEEQLRKEKEQLRDEKKRLEEKKQEAPKAPTSLKFYPPEPLCSSDGKEWKYQGREQLVSCLVQPMATHYTAWKQGRKDKRLHPLFTVLSGPGTGKVSVCLE